MPTALPDLDRLRPAGTKRSSKRDFIVNIFLRQEGHLTAEDLFDLIRRQPVEEAVDTWGRPVAGASRRAAVRPDGPADDDRPRGCGGLG